MSQFVHPIRCWLNLPLFCVAIHYTSNHLDAFEVYLGCSNRAVPGSECRLELPLDTVSCPQLCGFQDCHYQRLSSPFPQGYNLQWSSDRTWMAEAGSVLWNLPGPAALLRAGSMERAAWGHCFALTALLLPKLELLWIGVKCPAFIACC